MDTFNGYRVVSLQPSKTFEYKYLPIKTKVGKRRIRYQKVKVLKGYTYLIENGEFIVDERNRIIYGTPQTIKELEWNLKGGYKNNPFDKVSLKDTNKPFDFYVGLDLGVLTRSIGAVTVTGVC